MSENDPLRLADPASDASPRLRALLAAGRADGPSAETLAAILAKVEVPPGPAGPSGGGGPAGGGPSEIGRAHV